MEVRRADVTRVRCRSVCVRAHRNMFNGFSDGNEGSREAAARLSEQRKQQQEAFRVPAYTWPLSCPGVYMCIPLRCLIERSKIQGFLSPARFHSSQ